MRLRSSGGDPGLDVWGNHSFGAHYMPWMRRQQGLPLGGATWACLRRENGLSFVEPKPPFSEAAGKWSRLFVKDWGHGAGQTAASVDASYACSCASWSSLSRASCLPCSLSAPLPFPAGRDRCHVANCQVPLRSVGLPQQDEAHPKKPLPLHIFTPNPSPTFGVDPTVIPLLFSPCTTREGFLFVSP